MYVPDPRLGYNYCKHRGPPPEEAGGSHLQNPNIIKMALVWIGVVNTLVIYNIRGSTHWEWWELCSEPQRLLLVQTLALPQPEPLQFGRSPPVPELQLS